MPATEVNRPDRHVVQRHAAVLVWVPVILGGLLLDLPNGAPAMAAFLVLVVAGAVACVVAVVASWPRPTPRSSLAVAVLAAAVAAGSLAWSSWTPAWLLVAMSAAVALPTRASLVAVPASALASAWTLSRWGATRDELLAQAFVVLLAGAAAAAFSRLVSTADELRRTREELAEHAVARERERFSRDLHDTLGHSLSVVVVKAAVVRRLVPTDPAAATEHAADIEQVARQAMAQLRDTVDGAVVPRLDDELRQAQESLAAAGIRATVRTDQPAPAVAAAPLAWAVREGVTNVLRHSGASECRVEVTHAVGRVRLTITDDGLGALAALAGSATDAGRAGRRGGLDGLRARLSAAGGGLDVAPGDGGFSLTAWVPDGDGIAVIRVLLAEDQAMMRGALAVLLGLEPDIEVVAEVSTGTAILPRALETRPDVALLDIELPGRSGLDAAADLARALPGCAVVMVTTFARPGYVQRAMAAGARGFLVKDSPAEELADAVRRVAAGGTVVDPALARSALRDAASPLTDRERAVLVEAEGGATIADIAARMHLSVSTVRNYLSSAIGKTGTRNKVEAALQARRMGWL